MKQRWSLLILLGMGLTAFAQDRPAIKPVEKGPATAPSRIVAVTVYQGTALVTREVDVPVGRGLIEVVVSPLPPQTVASSLYSEGNDGMRILSTRFRSRAVKEDTREEVRAIQDRIKELAAQEQRLQQDHQVAQKNLTFISKLEQFTTATMSSLAEKGMLSGDTTLTLARHVVASRTDLNRRQVEIQLDLQGNREAMAFAQRQLAEVSAGCSRTERDAVIVVDKLNNPAAGKVQLKYMVGAASWKPQYKLRAGGEKEPVQIEYLAAIEQQSGEDWVSADLTLSTAQPMLNSAPPDLVAMEITVFRPVAGGKGQQSGQGIQLTPNVTADNQIQAIRLKQEAQLQFNSRNIALGNDLSNAGSVLTQQDELLSNFSQMNVFQNSVGFTSYPNANNTYSGQVVVANGELRIIPQFQAGQQGAAQQLMAPNAAPNANEVQQPMQQAAMQQDMDQQKLPQAPTVVWREGPSVTFHLKNKLTIPSRNDEQLVEVIRFNLPPEYFYKATPVLGSHVYRLARLTNSSEYVILPGEATMYVGKDFVGRMSMPLVVEGEQFTAGFGVDPQIQVTRQMVSKTRANQGANQVHTFDFRLRVNSYKPAAVKLQLWDRVPKADAESVAVTINKPSVELSADPQYQREDRPENLLRWDLTIQPDTRGEKATEVTYSFKLEYARAVQIGNFKAAPAKAQ